MHLVFGNMDEKFYKNKWLMLALAVVVVIAGVSLFRNRDNGLNDSDVVQAGETQVVGSFACLPYKTSGNKTDCVLGIKGDDGNVYALNTTALQGGDADINPEDKIRMIGVLEPASTTSEESKIFDIFGVMKVRILKKA
ncbi:hypothetical protein KW790_03140 [Candidatus Parcubacteria bacterium]|nr:hypothetical protein [Candidatus Parcubacteria bacterium]